MRLYSGLFYLKTCSVLIETYDLIFKTMRKKLLHIFLPLLLMSASTLGAIPRPIITTQLIPATLTVGQPYTIYWSTGSTDDLGIHCSNGGPEIEPYFNGSFSGVAQPSWVANPPVCRWTATNQDGMTATASVTLTTVGLPPNTNESAIVGYSIPSTMVQGRSYTASVTVQNTGTTTWTAGENYLLGPQNPHENRIWGVARVPLVHAVAPWQQHTFNFTVVAPAGGAYDVQWQMLREGHQWFGAKASAVVTVIPATNNAQILSQNVPAKMVAGQSYPVSVKVKNTGNTTWTPGGRYPYRLGSATSADTVMHGISRIEINDGVPPGADATFNFNVIPTVAGNFPLQWRMVQEDREWFGDVTSPVNAVVDRPVPTISFTQPVSDIAVTATGGLTPVTFAGTAKPGPGGAMTSLQLQAGGVTFASGVTSVSAVKSLEVGTHVIELVATDDGGLTASVRRTVTVSLPSSGSLDKPIPVAVVPPHLQNPVAGSLPGDLKVGTDGAATYQIDVALPPSSGNLQPQLSLSYSSNGSNGMVGLGWVLGGLSTIHRCPKTIAEEGFPGRISFDAADRLCLDGAKLVQANGTANQDASYWSPNAEYRTELERFARATRLANGGFRVETKDGLIKYYGIDAGSAIAAQGRSDGQALLWALARVEDRSGNFYTLEYNQDAASGEYTPRQIRYGANSAASQFADLAVRLEYEARPDAQIQYMGGSRNDLRSRLTHIRTFIDTDSSGNGGTLVRDYELHYKVSVSSGRSLVDWVQVSAHNPLNGVTEFLPKTIFSWGDNDSASVIVGTPLKLDVLSDGETSPIRTFNADIDGSGRTSVIVPWFDFLRPNSSVMYFNGRLLGTRVDGNYLAVDLILPTAEKIYTQVVPGDLNGDGRDDLILVATGATKKWAYCLAGEAVNNNPIFSPCVDASASLVNKDLISSLSPPTVISLRNDGKAQVLWFRARTSVTACDLGVGGMTCSAIPASIAIPENVPVFGFNPIELSRQGMSDFYSTWYNGSSGMGGLNLCNYRAAGIQCRQLESGLRRFDSPVVGDINGDALTDIVYTGQSVFRCLSTEADIDCVSRPMPSNIKGRIFLGGIGDSIGDGVPRILFYDKTLYHSCRDSADGWVCQTANIVGAGQSLGEGYSSPTYEPVYIDDSDVPAELICDETPRSQNLQWSRNCMTAKLNVNASQDRIVAIVNGIGLREEVDYARGNDIATYRRHAIIDGVVKRPVYPQLVAPAGVLVKQLRRDNGQGGWLKNDYRYEGAMRDGHGRGSLGFALVQSFDHQSGITTTTTFEQTFPFVGMVKTSRRATAQCTLENAVNTPAQHVLTMPNGGRTYFPYIASISKLRRDLDCSDLDAVTTQNEYTDGWGNLNIQTVVSEGGGRKFKSSAISSFMTTGPVHLSGLPVSVTTTRTDPDTGSISRSVRYTHNASSGLIETETVEPGRTQLLTVYDRSANSFGRVNKVVQRWADPACNTAGWPEIGCIIQKERTVSDTTYDVKGRFPVTVKNALGHSTSQTFSAQTGVRTSLTDPNNLITKWTLDGFGRVLTELRPDGNETRSYLRACAGDCPTDTKVIEIIEQFHGNDRIAVPQIAYSDSERRLRRTKTWGFNGEPIVTDQRFDSKGQLYEVDRPRFESAAAYLDRRHLYDDLGRHISTTTIDESGVARTSSVAFQGLTTTHTNAKNQKRVEKRDVLGRVRQVFDSNTKPGPGLTSFDYDAFDNLSKTIDPNNNVVSVTYDDRGRRTDLRDPDLGWRHYDVDPIGQVYAETSPMHPTKTMTWNSYDMLGRMTGRYEPELESHWLYDTAANGIGKLAEAFTGPATLKDYRRMQTYDAFGRPLVTTQILSDASYVSQPSYDLWGRVTSQSYQRGTDAAKIFGLRYNSYGYLVRLERGGLVLWEVSAQDAAARQVKVVQGNGLTQSRSFNPYSGRLDNASVTTSAQVARLQEAYLYDPLGNVRQRSQYWDQGGFDEGFTYDALNRLETSTIGSTELRMTYDAVGNITSKTGLGSYSYPAQGANAVRPHAVQGIAGIPGSFDYDNNGNLTAGAGRTATWTTFDMPRQIAKGSASANFIYGPEHQRVRQIRSDSTTVVYAGAQEVEINGGNRTVKTYWPMGIGVEIDRPGGASSELNWTQLDRLGSPVALTDASGAIREKLEYDAWGKRRSTADHRGTPDMLDGVTDNRGFTGHEMLDQLDLVHMNGRVYDPSIGRFMSGDPMIQEPMNGQNYNRYSYVSNNPANLVDPTGLFEEQPATTGQPPNLTLTGRGLWGSSWDQLPQNDAAHVQGGAAGRSENQSRRQTRQGNAVNAGSANTSPPSLSKAAVINNEERSDKKVALQLNLIYSDEDGKNVSSKLTTDLTRSAEKTWSGKVGANILQADFDNPGATPVKVKLHQGAGVSNTNKVGGDSINLYLGGYQRNGGSIIPYSSETLRATFSHEVGHALGAADRYQRGVGEPYSGHENNIMGAVRGGNRPLPSTIDEILRFNQGQK